VIIGSGFFDLVDGQVARATNRVTRFGAFFDSVVDRYSDASQFWACWSSTRAVTASSTLCSLLSSWLAPSW
jgi:phosphatidylglycerophosphate synthase